MFRSCISTLVIVVWPLAAAFGGGIFTVNIGNTGNGAPVTTPLVQHSNDWRYRFGTNAPQTDWKSASDTLLEATWLTGPGGFGYEDGDDATVLNVMSNRFSTLYVRREFLVSNSPNTNEQLRLIMDWDDGFVAWLDGEEVARSSNAPGAPGTEPAYNAISLQPNHEASAGGGAAPATYNLGRAVDRLPPGRHVLAVLGLNGATNSSDFSLIADLEMFDSSAGGGATTNQYITIVQSTPLLLSGSNTVASAARVTVNGIDAVFSIAEGTWRWSQPLNPGMNRLFIASLDSAGNILASANRDVVFEPSTILAGGLVASDTSWSSVVRVTNNVSIPNGVTLTVEPGTVLLLSNGISITATGTVNVAGTELNPVFVFPAGTAPWGNFGANGTNASATFRYAETAGGQLRVVNGGTLLIEDSVVRDLPESGREIIAGVNGGGLTVRRSHVTRFTEVDARDTPVLIEQCLLEQFLVDGVDIKATNSPLVVRSSTLRYGSPTNSNADAVDFGPGAGTVERCLIHDFRDKGVSIGGAPGTRVSGSVIYNCGIGISAYSSTNLVLVNNTISGCDNGILFRDNPQPAIGAATNLIVWGNLNNVVLSNTSTLNLTGSDVQGGAPAGEGNISVDPQFINPAIHDYRLASTSPARGAGFGGTDMGAVFPVGGIPATPSMLAAHPSAPGSVRLSWQEDSDNEEAFVVERSLDGGTWASAGTVVANSLGFTDNGLSASLYFYRVATTNSLGKSRYSNIASARPASDSVSETFVGGQLTESTTWNPAMGIIYVRSNIIVPANMVLTMAEGTIVRVTNGASIRAVAGGAINVLGSESNKVVISRWDTNAVWGELSANGTNASLYVRHADISGGQTTVYNAAAGLIEDSYFHDYRITGTTLTQPIVLSQFARLMTMRRSHVQTYYETLFRNGVIIIEDCLFEDISGDGLDFDAAQTGTVLRRSTFRNGTLGNVDAVDVGPAELGGSRDVIIEDCLMYNFPFDKGVSVGDAPSQATGTIVRNCLIYGCLSGVMAKDSCVVTVYNCTIVDNSWGFTNYSKVNPAATNGGGHTIAWNNILWDNDIAVSLWNASTLAAWYNDLGNTNWPGEGNINADPLFLDPAARDYRLSSASPCIGAGSNGVAMGVTFPVGGVPTAPVNLVIITNHGAQVLLAWNDTNGNESGFIIEASTNLSDWVVVGSAPRDSLETLAPALFGLHFRAKATNFIGVSFASNVASATAGDTDGDGMPDSWENTYGFDAGNPSDGTQDADSDGQSNLSEFLSGTDPRNAASRFGISSILPVGSDGVRLSFTAQAGKTYAIQFRESITTGDWQELIDVPAEGNARLYTFTDTLPPGTRTRFYRLIIP
jgi:parallel beta-helix repeat protein